VLDSSPQLTVVGSEVQGVSVTSYKDPDNVSSRKKSITVNVPPGLPEPTPKGWRILLEILCELTAERGIKFEKDRKPAHASTGTDDMLEAAQVPGTMHRLLPNQAAAVF